MILDDLLPSEQIEQPSFVAFRGKNSRTLYNPNDAMHDLQRNLLDFLRPMQIHMSYAHGAIRRRSTKTNVMAHRGNRFFYTLDLSKAYETVDVEVMAQILCQYHLDLRHVSDLEVREWLQRFCFRPSGGLYTGAAAAAALFNLYCGILIDRPLESFLRQHGASYTRYFDDLCFSHPEQPFGTKKRRRVRDIVHRAGFELAEHKTRVNHDIRRSPILITGILLTHDGRLITPPAKVRRAKGMANLALMGQIDSSIAYGHIGHVLDTTDKPNKNTRLLEEISQQLPG